MWPGAVWGWNGGIEPKFVLAAHIVYTAAAMAAGRKPVRLEGRKEAGWPDGRLVSAKFQDELIECPMYTQEHLS